MKAKIIFCGLSIEQEAEKIYDQTEDLNSNDKETNEIISNAIEKLTKIDPSSIDEIGALVAEAKRNLKQ